MSDVRILVGTPCAQGGLAPEYLHTMQALQTLCADRGWTLRIETRSDGLVTRSRNIFASRVARDDTFTHLLMVDSDIGFDPVVVERLVDSGHPVVGACVPFRETVWPRVRDALDGTPDLDADELASLSHGYAVSFLRSPIQQAQGGFLPVRFLGGALMVVSREALTRLTESDHVRHYASGGRWKDWPDDGWTFFDPLVDPDGGIYLSEDYAFCLRWRSVGGQVHADLHSRVIHAGTISVRGDVERTLRTARRLVAARTAAPSSAPDPDHGVPPGEGGEQSGGEAESDVGDRLQS